jgi:hypothetical protein
MARLLPRSKDGVVICHPITKIKDILPEKELLWKAGHEPNSASTTTTPKPLTGDDKFHLSRAKAIPPQTNY